MDIDHIEWMMRDALLVCKKEMLDESLLLPLVILHDVGYAAVPKDNPFKLNMRELHMKAGARIAKKILLKLNYPLNKIVKIVRDVSVHDNWAFGKNALYKKDLLLGTFNDLDYIWTATPKGFAAVRKILCKSRKEMVAWLENNEKPRMRPFATKTTKKLYMNYLRARKRETRN